MHSLNGLASQARAAGSNIPGAPGMPMTVMVAEELRFLHA